MKVAVVSIDSEIGEQVAQVHEQRGDTVITSSRNGNGTRHMELTQPKTWFLPTDIDRVYYTLGIGGEKHSRQETMNVNALLPIDYLSTLAARANSGCTFVVYSSEYGSIGMTRAPKSLAYRMTKAALNMGVKCLSLVYPQHTWLLVHPGTVQTKIAKTKLLNPITARDSAEQTVATADSHAGPIKFLKYDGTELPW